MPLAEHPAGDGGSAAASHKPRLHIRVVTNDHAALHGSAPFPPKERHHTRCSRNGGPFHNQRKAKSDSSRPDFEVVDDRPKLALSERNIVLLMRSALLDDARNVSERLGALLAEITVDEDNDVSISLDEDLWPDHKEPTHAIKVATQLVRDGVGDNVVEDTFSLASFGSADLKHHRIRADVARCVCAVRCPFR